MPYPAALLSSPLSGLERQGGHADHEAPCDSRTAFEKVEDNASVRLSTVPKGVPSSRATILSPGQDLAALHGRGTPKNRKARWKETLSSAQPSYGTMIVASLPLGRRPTCLLSGLRPPAASPALNEDGHSPSATIATASIAEVFRCSNPRTSSHHLSGSLAAVPRSIDSFVTTVPARSITSIV
jgi:hypothetical protein